MESHNQIIVKDDLVCPALQDAIHAIAAAPNMAWYNGGEHDRYTGMSSPIFDGGNGGQIIHPALYYLSLPILMQTAYTVLDANVSEVMRFRIGLFLHTMNMKNKSTKHRMHVDYDFPHQNMLYYVNDSDGDTTIIDWDDKEDKIQTWDDAFKLTPTNRAELLKQQDENKFHFKTFKNVSNFAETISGSMITHTYNTPGIKTIKARDVWFKILDSQMETGTPYMLYKDSSNRKSNQKNLGTIRSSNLCTEILEYTSKDEVAVCNLASIALSMFVKDGEFDHQALFDVTKQVTKNLNRVIDRNYYPVKEAENSNFRHRPIGLGVQGLADTFILLRLPFTSDEAKKLNQEIFETLYFAAVTSSMEEAKKDKPYQSYKGSPISEGEFQHNLWGIKDDELSGRWDWKGLRKLVKKHGVRNSLLVAPMPTASTSQILGNNECFEPYTSNIYTRRVLSGEFIVVNKHLLEDLVNLGLWNEDLKQELMRNNGSVQNIEVIPDDIKELYRTVWELSMKDIIDMARQRGYFIDQSQSLNLFVEGATMSKLTSMHFYGWKSGLKTGMYYLRTKSAVDAIKFTLDNTKSKAEETKVEVSAEATTSVKEKGKKQVAVEPLKPEELKQMLDKSKSSEDDDCLMCGS